MLKKGIDPDSPEAQLFGRKLLSSLTEVFGKSILGTGFFHAGKQSKQEIIINSLLNSWMIALSKQWEI